MFNLKSYIRIIFFSLMSLPLIILVYFIINFSQCADYIAEKAIAWPDKGLLTLWFDDAFFMNNKKTITDLMNKYHFSGVIALSNAKHWHSRSLSRYQLLMLQNQGWEITEKNLPRSVNGQHKINDMPTSRTQKLAIYDMSSDNNDLASLPNVLKKTNLRNGWIILYFHENHSDLTKESPSMIQLEHALRMIKHSDIPVVLQQQVLNVSQ